MVKHFFWFVKFHNNHYFAMVLNLPTFFFYEFNVFILIFEQVEFDFEFHNG
jgi:hypothetical protein